MTEIDRSGAPSAVKREVARRDFLKTAAWAGAALSAAGIGGFGFAATRAKAQGEPFTTYQGIGDAAILSLAYQLELLEGTFYQMGVDMGTVSGNALTQIQAIAAAEFEHADALAATLGELGAEIPATPEFTFPDGAFEDTAAFLQLGNTFEPVGIGAYQAAAPALESKEILGAALSIHNAECEHWNGIKILLGIDPPNDTAFEEALPLPAVQEAVAPFGVG